MRKVTALDFDFRAALGRTPSLTTLSRKTSETLSMFPSCLQHHYSHPLADREAGQASQHPSSSHVNSFPPESQRFNGIWGREEGQRKAANCQWHLPVSFPFAQPTHLPNPIIVKQEHSSSYEYFPLCWPSCTLAPLP